MSQLACDVRVLAPGKATVAAALRSFNTGTGLDDDPDIDGVAAQRGRRRRHQVHGVGGGAAGLDTAAALDAG